MKNFWILLLTTFSTAISLAQGPGGMPGMAAPPAVGHIFGKLTDSGGKAIPDASVLLLQSRMDSLTHKRKETLLKGTLTKNNGDFSLEELPLRGELKLSISASGYTPFEQTISFMGRPAAGGPPAGMPSSDKDLGTIRLKTDVTQLQNVTVTSTKAMLRLDGEKKVFNVEKNLVSAGGTAVDVMKNVPSLNVDIDGNVTLRNASPQIFVDGRPTTLSLDQIPADAIESVEVVTNPSAKYDASGGGAGILNIVLKKNRKTGYNGNIRAGVDKRGALNGGGDISLRQGKFNISASIMGNQNKGRATGTTERLNLLDSPQTSITQSNYNKTQGGFLFGKFGLDYFMTNRTTLSLSGIRVHGEFSPNESINIRTDSLYSPTKVAANSRRISTGSREFNGKGLVLGLKHLFPKEGEELTADANYFTGKNLNNALYTTTYFGSSGNISGTEQQKVIGDGSNSFLTLQADYVKPVTAKLKMEAGLRASLRRVTNNNGSFLYDPVTGSYLAIPAALNNYKNNDNVYAAYATVSNSIKDFSYKIGLRAESSEYEGELLNTKEKFGNKYPVSLFPSVFLNQKLKSDQQLQLSYSRRINRPNFFQLIPFIDYSDKLNITKGNPDLVPEFTQSLEMSYLKTFQANNTLLASVYYKYTDNLITRYLDRQLNPLTGTEDLINTFINANSSYATGAELTSQNGLAKWWDISTNVNLYNSKINTGSTQDAQSSMWSWFGKFNSNFRLPENFSVQFTATYQSKTNLPVNTNMGMQGPPMMQSQSASQGFIRANYGLDLAVKKSFLKNQAASVTLSINDILRSRWYDQYSESAYFVQNYNRLRDPQMIRLNFAYRFGKVDASIFKRKNNRDNLQNSTEGM